MTRANGSLFSSVGDALFKIAVTCLPFIFGVVTKFFSETPQHEQVLASMFLSVPAFMHFYYKPLSDANYHKRVLIESICAIIFSFIAFCFCIYDFRENPAGKFEIAVVTAVLYFLCIVPMLIELIIITIDRFKSDPPLGSPPKDGLNVTVASST